MTTAERLARSGNRSFVVTEGHTSGDVAFILAVHEGLGIPCEEWVNADSYCRLFEFDVLVESTPMYWTHGKDQQWLVGLWDLLCKGLLEEWRAGFAADPLGWPHPYYYAWLRKK